MPTPLTLTMPCILRKSIARGLRLEPCWNRNAVADGLDADDKGEYGEGRQQRPELRAERQVEAQLRQPGHAEPAGRRYLVAVERPERGGDPRTRPVC